MHNNPTKNQASVFSKGVIEREILRPHCLQKRAVPEFIVRQFGNGQVIMAGSLSMTGYVAESVYTLISIATANYGQAPPGRWN